MIHFTCDGCQQPIDPDQQIRYVLRIEVYAAADEVSAAGDSYTGGEDPSERDHLGELDELLERVDDYDDQQLDEACGQEYRQVRYDLCPECRARLLANPLGRLALGEIGFSNN